METAGIEQPGPLGDDFKSDSEIVATTSLPMHSDPMAQSA